MLPYRVKDLRWTPNGDLVIGQDGDIGDTSLHSLASFVQEVRTRLMSELYDWRLHPQLGADLSSLVGEANTRNLAEEGKAMIVASLTRDGFCSPGYVTVRYIPVAIDEILYTVRIALPNTTQQEVIELSLVVRTDEFEMVFV